MRVSEREADYEEKKKKRDGERDLEYMLPVEEAAVYSARRRHTLSRV